MSKTFNCSFCGKETVKTGRNQNYCKDCSDKAALARKREHNAMLRDVRAANKHKSADNHASIVGIASAAKQRGLTYGQMVAMGVR